MPLQPDINNCHGGVWGRGRIKMRIVLVLGAALAIGGCATITRGTDSNVGFEFSTKRRGGSAEQWARLRDTLFAGGEAQRRVHRDFHQGRICEPTDRGEDQGLPARAPQGSPGISSPGVSSEWESTWSPVARWSTRPTRSLSLWSPMLHDEGRRSLGASTAPRLWSSIPRRFRGRIFFAHIRPSQRRGNNCGHRLRRAPRSTRWRGA